MLTEHGVQIAPSTYYAHAERGFGPSEAELADAYAANTLFDLWVRNRGLYGQLKLWHTARRAGHGWGRDQVARLMGIAGVTGVRRGRRTTVTTRRDEKASRHPDHINRAWDTPARPDQWWVADFSYVWTLAGFCYVSFVTDVYSRRILGWRVTTSKTTSLVLSALDQALFTRRRTSMEFTADGLVHHSDAGSQYTSLAFTEALLEAGITGSIGSVGDALDNALHGIDDRTVQDRGHRPRAGFVDRLERRREGRRVLGVVVQPRAPALLHRLPATRRVRGRLSSINHWSP